MKPGVDPLTTTTSLRRLLGRVLGPASRPVCPAIHPDDEMLTYAMQVLGRSPTAAVLEYFQVGHATFSLLTQVLDWLGTEWSRIGSVLDFASGYGRVARFLATAGCQRVAISDILAPAVEFQRRELGVQAFLSTARPEQAQLGGPYDFISVISLFSHLPETTFFGWLQTLGAALAPGGVLLFTTHGESAFAREGGKALGVNAFHFYHASESSQLDTASYGNSFVHPTYVQRLIGKLRGIRLLACVPHGLNDHQDVYVLGRDRAVPGEPLRLTPVPKVCIDTAQLGADGRLQASGWALDGTGQQPAQTIELFTDEQDLGPARLGVERPDLVRVFHAARAAAGGWELAASSAASPSWLAALATDPRGRRGFACQPIAAAMSPDRRGSS